MGTKARGTAAEVSLLLEPASRSTLCFPARLDGRLNGGVALNPSVLWNISFDSSLGAWAPEMQWLNHPGH